MSIDPEDGCTFWFTGEMMPLGGTTWTTQIAAFSLPECSTPTAVTLATLEANERVPSAWLGAAALLALGGLVLLRKR